MQKEDLNILYSKYINKTLFLISLIKALKQNQTTEMEIHVEIYSKKTFNVAILAQWQQLALII
ncbi:CLUMA_CG021201, isoform A [Clunio marinus]|uniref:CLUMA_CG021201, isoform A n=1 Tax=Clunio marinus TaxID=568069 RepID=A0A1J1J882_9DIPT|nr:CLUMA_CG021201, isoform A [Clunio marinus]